MAWKRRILWLFTAGLVALGGQIAFVPAIAATPEILTLEDAVALALQNNRNVQNAAAEAEKTDAALAALRTRRYPNLNLRYTGAQQLNALDFEFKRGSLGNLSSGEAIPTTDTIIPTPRQWENQGQAVMAQPLAQLYRLSLEIDQVGLAKTAAEEKYRQSRTAVVNDVRKTYFGILESQSALRAVREAMGFYTELERLMTDHLRQQTILRAELLEVRSKLARARYDATRTENALTAQKEQLNHLLGRDLATPFSVSAAVNPAPPEMDLAAAVARARERRPEIREAKLKARQAEYGIRIKRSEYIPDVDLIVSYTRLPEMEIMPKDYAYAGIRVSWEPFDWGRRSQELSERKKTLAQANTAAREAESLVMMDVSHRWRALRESHQYLALTRLNAEAARERLRVVMDRYRQQIALAKDLLQTQAQAAEADHQVHQALLACLAAHADFQKALGGE